MSATGDGAFLAAAPLLAAALTGDPVDVAAVSVALFLPAPLFGLFAGALADRWPRRTVMLCADIGRAVVVAGLAVGVASGQLPILGLVVAAFLLGIGQTLFDAAAQATIPAVIGVDPEVTGRFFGRFWALDTAGRYFLGPPAGSLTFALARPLPFAGDALSFLGSAAAVTRLPRIPAAPGPHPPLGLAIAAGVRHVRRSRPLLILAAGGGTLNLATNGMLAVFVLYAAQVEHVPAAGYGLLLAAQAAGGVAAGWLLGKHTARVTAGTAIAGALAVNAAAWAVAVAVPDPWLTGAVLAVSGAANCFAGTALGSARAAHTPDVLLGRVVSVFRLALLGGAALGALGAGWLAAAAGIRAPYLAGVAVLAVAALVVAVLSRRANWTPGRL